MRFKLREAALLNEFYEKESQEKTSASTGGRGDLGLALRPTACRSTRICSGVCSERFPSLAFSGSDNKHDRVRRTWRARMISAW